VVLTSKDCGNLKGALKKLIHLATARGHETEYDEGDEDLVMSGSGSSKVLLLCGVAIYGLIYAKIRALFLFYRESI
jgi:hypothetical protein